MCGELVAPAKARRIDQTKLKTFQNTNLLGRAWRAWKGIWQNLGDILCLKKIPS
jgi:hypothetical protein